MLKKNIILFTDQFPYGQQETFLENELIYLTRVFEKVTVVPLFSDTHCRKPSYNNLEVLPAVYDSRRITISKLNTVRAKSFWWVLFVGVWECKWNVGGYAKVLKQAIIVAGLKKYLSKRPNLYQCYKWYFYWGTNSVNVINFLDKSPEVVARFHRYDLYAKEVEGGEFQLFQKKSIEKLDHVFFVSKHGLDYATKLYPIFSKKFTVSRLGVPQRGVNVASNDGVLRIVTCSNLYPVKRVEIVAKALKLITNIDIEWTHIGDGPEKMRNEIFDLARMFPGNVKFKFLGRVSNIEIMSFYKNNPVDVFVNVSLSEGLPVSIMEALSFGIPVIATDVGGTGELVSSNCGTLLDANVCPKQLSCEIKEFFSNYYQDRGIRDSALKVWRLNVSSEDNYCKFVKSI